MKLVTFVGKFVLALILGSTVAAVISVATSSAEKATPLIVGTAATYAMFGLVPAAVIGLPVLRVFRRLSIPRPVVALLSAVGGAVVGALLMTFTFTGFEGLGAIAGASIGLMQGFLLYNHGTASTDAAVS